MTGGFHLRRQRPARPAAARPRDAYTRFVTLMKLALPGLAFLIVVAAVFWPQFVRTGTEAAESAGAAPTAAGLRNSAMEAPVYVATDDSNRPFRLTALRARDISGNGRIVALDRPQAKLRLADGDHVSVRAREGRFDRSDRRLTLFGEVDLEHGGGYRFRTAEATLDMKTNTAWSGQAVRAAGPEATVAAEGFLTVDRGQTVMFTGRTRAILRLADESPKGADGPMPGSGQ